MKIKDLFLLDSDLLVKYMRDSGISHLSCGEYSITLSQAPTEVKVGEIEPSRFEDEADKEKLPCGHSIWEANETGECLMGCVNKPAEDK